MKLQIDPKRFMFAGMLCFLIIAIASSLNLYIIYRNLTVFAIISSLANIIFSFLTSGFFYYMLKSQQEDIDYTNTDDHDVEDVLKELKGYKTK